jgi:hypothetical protein
MGHIFKRSLWEIDETGQSIICFPRGSQFDVYHNLHHHRRHHHYDADDLWSDLQTQLHMPFRTSGPQVIGDCQLNLHISIHIRHHV